MTHSTICDLARLRAARSLLRRAAPAATLVALALHTTGAAAESAEDAVAAAALFKAGRELLATGEIAKACSRFEASMKLHATASTMLNIARCQERDGRIGTAWLDYQRGLVLNRETQGVERQATLEKVAHDAIAALEPRLPRLRIAIANPPPELRITHDGQELPLTTLGEPLPDDPGDHQIVATAPGFRDAKVTVKLEEGKVVEVALALEKSAPSSAPAHPPPILAPPPALALIAAPTFVVPAPPSADEGGGRRVPAWAWGAAGLGLAAGVGAAAFRVDWANLDGKQATLCHGDVQHGCPPPSVYDPSSDNARKDRDRALFIGLGAASAVGLGAAVVGIVRAHLAKTRRPLAQAAPWVGAGSAGAAMKGDF